MAKRIRFSPYAVLSACALVAAVLIARQGPWVADFWLHAATVDRLSADLANPGNPTVDADTGSPYYTPYTWLLAIIARTTGWSGINVLAVWAPVNVALLLFGVWAFARRFGRSPWLPVALFLSMVLIWGTLPLGWSGFMSLYGLPLVMAYPSTFAFALTLILWAELLRPTEAPRPVWRTALPLAGLGTMIVLSHQFTAVLAALGAAAIVVSQWRKLTGRIAAGLGVAIAVVLTGIAAWPYYHPSDLLAAAGILDVEHVMLYESWRGLFGYTFIALPLLALRFIANRRDPLVLMFGAGVVVVGYGALSGHWAWGRMIALVVFAGQAAIAFAAVRWLSHLRTRWDAWTAVQAISTCVALVAALIGIRVQGGNLLHVAPVSVWTQRIVDIAKPVPGGPDYAWVADHIWAREVVASTDRDALREIPAYGAYLVGPAWPDPLLADEAERRADQASILNPATAPERRRSLIEKYRVRWVLFGSADATVPGDLRIYARVPGPAGQLLLRIAD